MAISAMRKLRKEAMEIKAEGDKVFLCCTLSEAKLLYRALFRTIDLQSGEIDEHNLIMPLQSFLHQKAVEQGVDISDHSRWEDFLDSPLLENFAENE